jgi:hypothetical protein
VRSEDGTEFFLEAVLAGERDGRNPASEAIKNSTIGVLDARPHTNFLLDIQSNGDPITQPSSRDLIRRTHEWLDGLDPDYLLESLAIEGLDQMATLRWMHEGWKLSLRAIPLPAEKRGKATMLIGAHGDGVRWVNAWESLRSAVKKKANRYGEISKPLIVAINTDRFHLDQIDEEQALYGEEQWVEVIGHPDRGGPRRVENGAWRGPHGPQCRKVSGVWFFNDLTPYTLATRRSTVYLNPWAHNPAPPAMDRFPTRRLVGDSLIASEGLDLRSMFGVDADWPE